MRFEKLNAVLGRLTGLVLAGVTLRAQGLPARPPVLTGQDTNSASSYVAVGTPILAQDPVKATRAFVWATRLDPGRAESWYGLWIAEVLSLPDLAFNAYMKHAFTEDQDPTLHRVDSLVEHAERLDPLIHEGLDYLFIERWWRLYGEEGDLTTYVFGHPAFGGWLAYSHGDYDNAVSRYRTAIHDHPDDNVLHWARGQSFLLHLQYDSALAELRLYRDKIASNQQKDVGHFLRSHEMADYAIGRVEELRGNLAAARVEYDTALIENLGFVPAHLAVARLALARHDTADALREYDLATQQSDAVVCYAYGVLLWASHRPQDAATHFARAIAADSDYAPPYLPLGILEEGGGFDSLATVFYRGFIAHAPARLPQVNLARQHLAALAAKAGHP